MNIYLNIMSKSWCVVEFSDGVQIVPHSWITGDKCYWPTYSGINAQSLFKKAVVEYQAPDKNNWALYAMRILGIYDSYEQAAPKLKKAEIQSDINSSDKDESRSKKSRRVRKRVVHSSEEDNTDPEDEIEGIEPFPTPPTKKANLKITPNSRTDTRISQLPDQDPSPSTSTNKACNSSTFNFFTATPRSLTNPRTTSQTISGGTFKTLKKNLTLESDEENGITENNENHSSFISQITPRNEQGNCDCCKSCKDSRNKTNNDITEIKNQLKLLLQTLRERQTDIQENPNTDEINSFREKLPMKTAADVDSWEQILNSVDERKKMVTYLAKIGGHDINTIVKNILKALFTDFVASMYNWEGKKNKKMLSSLNNIVECIKEASMKSPNRSTKVTNQDIIDSIKNWLRHASARLNNSQKKNRDETG
ncbi:unnamed protein product [Ceutorhynchus assimilis]|uniref:DUF4806 domain-containing protein n=1 Tax=Ceutorhynchus assimilis TaxID=467358 RepID=A0A9N9MXB4_9CUCU|nr:unnamed protein product [Ceutorhynchus assimilis]